MTPEEMQRTMEFIVTQQAQLTATVGTLAEAQARLTATVERLAEKVDAISAKVDRNAESATALLAIAEIHDREIRETDERLNALINTVERHISEGRNGK
jgi:peptidoglycan hydrolase CwlO-like protein